MRHDRTISVKVRNASYPVTISGEGVPTLVIGIGTLMQRTLSSSFKQLFEVYSTDLYWDARTSLPNPSALTMQDILDDIAELSKNLKLPPFILLGHSAYGIVALEFAKQFPKLLKGVIMIGSPLNSNLEVAQQNDAYFKAHADLERKKIDSERRVQFSPENLSELDPASKFLQEYIWRDAARYWHNPAYICSSLWDGIVLDPVINHFFSDILPGTDVKKGLDTIPCPIFLAAGMSDYDCCPWVWAELDSLPPQIQIVFFEKSGHYPHFEEPTLFDAKIQDWMDDLDK